MQSNAGNLCIDNYFNFIARLYPTIGFKLHLIYFNHFFFNLFNFFMPVTYVSTYRRFNAIVSQLKMHYFSEGAFENLIASQLLKKEKYI